MTALPDDILDLLTAYALDALEPEEMARVSQLLEQQPELRHLLAELRASVDVLPYALPEANPPADLRQRTLDVATGRVSRTSLETTSATESRTRLQPLRRWLMALSGMAVVALIALTVTLSQLAGVQADLAQTQVALATSQAQQQQVASALFGTSVVAELQGDVGNARVLQTPEGAALLAANLPPLEEGQIYQLWLIEGDAAPISGAVFAVDAAGQQLITLPPELPVATADLFAITAEPGPAGSPGPTTPILVAGEPA